MKSDNKVVSLLISTLIHKLIFQKSTDQLSFHFPTSVSASDGELNKCLDEVEPIGPELQKSWSNGINKNLIEEVSKDEKSQKDFDENLRRNSNNNNKNERKTSSVSKKLKTAEIDRMILLKFVCKLN